MDIHENARLTVHDRERIVRQVMSGQTPKAAALEMEAKIAAIVHRLLRDRSMDREFGFEENLRDIGLTSLDMTSLVSAVEAEFAVEIPDRAITPANFTSVTSIGDLVRTLRPRQWRPLSDAPEPSAPAPIATPRSTA
jgi:acyl carrier protein